MIEYASILIKNYGDKQWAINGNSYDELEWLDQSPKPTKEELDSLAASTELFIAKNNCKETAKQLLANSDWAVLPDVGLANFAEYVTYRGILRGYVTQPQVNPDFPVEPTPIWSN